MGMKKLKHLERLKPGDAIGIFSPSAPATYSSPKRFQRAKTFLEAKGFVIVEGKLTGKTGPLSIWKHQRTGGRTE